MPGELLYRTSSGYSFSLAWIGTIVKCSKICYNILCCYKAYQLCEIGALYFAGLDKEECYSNEIFVDFCLFRYIQYYQ